jgi:hypothetical protein
MALVLVDYCGGACTNAIVAQLTGLHRYSGGPLLVSKQGSVLDSAEGSQAFGQGFALSQMHGDHSFSKHGIWNVAFAFGMRRDKKSA